MKDLLMDIPPFSPDTSGFASVMSGTDGLGLFDDVRGCAGNYYASEEVRTDINVRVYTSELGNEDAVCGSEKNMMKRFDQLFENLDPSFALLSSSPIAALIGTDLETISRKLSCKYNIPVSGVSLDGYGAYDEGISKTLCTFADKFVKETEKRQGINLIGANYMDWSSIDMENLRSEAERFTGEKVISVLGGDCKFEEICRAGEARLNYVLTVSGLACAKILEKRFGTPYVCGAPFGENAFYADKKAKTSENAGKHGVKTLIVSEQYTGNALRDVLNKEFGYTDVSVGSFFMMDKEQMAEGDIRFKGEDEFKAYLGSGKFEIVFADHMVSACIPDGTRSINFQHLPVSSRVFADERPALLKDGAKKWLETQLF